VSQWHQFSESLGPGCNVLTAAQSPQRHGINAFF